MVLYLHNPSGIDFKDSHPENRLWKLSTLVLYLNKSSGIDSKELQNENILIKFSTLSETPR